ncbi:decaprenyl-phosphate phosphoribosyltransferase [Acrocarpospora pleiomorpha]|uniref:Decaprenyl-phosphate phosphoribosyltransferase n=1 Tax=Acrocarpospora pleiomorpha TaxID=90975 RepID=A0A5M3XFQ2_9ACTN|nr:decaprenyl-phosphate phosphoribosyltransferase [Acrocarpospora pleiomorpha]GES19562.1 decaprenyl-phosphate phosphoribosyltransferase [Acrocarpospora pleiomorpha]
MSTTSTALVAPPTRLGGLVRTARPRQWVKNVLVAAAPLAAERYDGGTLAATAVAFVAFCCAASAVYFLNDVLDANEDRAHPDKRLRPVAAGIVPESAALGGAAALAVAALTLTLAWQPVAAGVLAAYLLINVCYCRWLKHVPIVDLAVVSSGFLLRAVYGGAMAAVPLTRWFLIVIGATALFAVAGKRFSELARLGADGLTARPSLDQYSVSYLRFVWQAAGTVAMTVYCLWAFPAHSLTIIPFGLAFLRYAWHIDRAAAGAPESVVFGDRWLLGLGGVWVVLFVAANG